MRKALIYLLIFVVLLVAPSAIRYAQFHTLTGGEATPPPAYDVARISENSAVPTPAAGNYTDEPQNIGPGIVLVDQAHDNQFTMEEIGYLDGRLAARGFEFQAYDGGDLAAALRPANAFVVISPLSRFSQKQIQAVADYVQRGGRLLLIGDPTRINLITNEEDFFASVVDVEDDEIPLNELANRFDLAFNGDYLYNLSDNEGNFRNIILEEDAFAAGDVTRGLEKVVFYSSHSLQVGSDAAALFTAGDDTWSSATDRAGGLVLAASSRDGRVLALGDLHFLTEPYYTVSDNGRFIAQLADFLTTSDQREFILADFPYFYRNPVRLIYTGQPDLGPDAFDEIIDLQDAFGDVNQTLTLANEAGDADALYLGLYNQAEDVAEMLATAGISLTISPPITDTDILSTSLLTDTETSDNEVEDEEPTRLIQSDLGNVQMAGTALLLLHRGEDEQRNVIVLAASNDGLETAVSRVLDAIPLNSDYAFADCLLQDTLALCPTGIPGETVEATLKTGGAPEADEEEAEEEEEPAPEEEEEEEETPTLPGENGPTDQGTITVDESVTGELEAEEAHAWTFVDGPAAIDVLVESEQLDLVLELYNPDAELVTSADDGFTGESEQIVTEIEEGDYTIVVRDFWAEPGAYTLTVTLADTVPDEGEEGEEDEEDEEDENGAGTENGVFIYADDDGTATAEGATAAARFTELLEDNYPVTIWSSSDDGPIQSGALDGVQLIIWASGDYEDEEGLFDEGNDVIFDYLDGGEGTLLVTGATPPLFNGLTTAPLADLEVIGDDPVLLDGFSVGDILELDQVYETVVSEFEEGDASDEETIMFLRGPTSDAADNIAGYGLLEEGETPRLVTLLFPYQALPDEIESLLLNNILTWFNLAAN